LILFLARGKIACCIGVVRPLLFRNWTFLMWDTCHTMPPADLLKLLHLILASVCGARLAPPAVTGGLDGELAKLQDWAESAG